MESYEKKYKEALSRAKQFSEHPLHEDSSNIVEYIFPELEESKDERIRKLLIEAVIQVLQDQYCSNRGVSKEKVVAWLEKQGNVNALIQEAAEKSYTEGMRIERKHWLEKQWKTDNLIKWHSVLEEPEEMRELLCEWDSDDSTWHEVAFYHSDTKTFWDGERQVENVTKWCYIDELFEKQGEQKSKDRYTFKSIPRLLDMIEPTNRAKSYCQKLIDSLLQEGYVTDAKIVIDCLKQMNGEKVAMAIMDEQKPTAWSEEDEKFFKTALWHISYSISNGESTDIHCDTTEWLKSLKQRIGG